MNAMTQLGNGLTALDHHDDALSVREVELATMRRLGTPEEVTIMTKANIAFSYEKLGRYEETLALRREVYAQAVAFKHPTDQIIIYANNLAVSLKRAERYEEAKCFLRERIAEGFDRTLGANHISVIKLRWNYAGAFCDDDKASRDDVVKAVATFEELFSTTQRLLGKFHPTTKSAKAYLESGRSKLARFDAQS
jgi:hypothetical protein